MNRPSLLAAVLLIGVALILFASRLGSQLSAAKHHEMGQPSTIDGFDTPPARAPGPRAKPSQAQIENPTGPQGPFVEFQTLASATLSGLPTVDDLRARPDRDSHFTPPELLAASPSLGKIADTLRQHAELIPQGIEFYDNCARREDTLMAVRVLCLRHLRYWTKKQPDVIDLDSSAYPDEISKLADSMPPVRD